MKERSVVLGSDEGAIAIRAWDDEPLRVTGELVGNTLVQGTQAAEGELWLLSADQWGPFEVTTRVWDARPGEAGEDWEDVLEFSMSTTSAVGVTELVNNDPTAEWLDVPGEWRVRVCARGRRVPDASGELDEGDEPVEWFLLEAWPASPDQLAGEPTTVRMSSSWAESELAGEAPPLSIPEGETGLAAARRIGLDVDNKPGARRLSGELASVEVSRTIQGTRRRLFERCAHLMTWSHVWLPAPSWSFSGGGNGERWGYSHDHPDQLTGSTGAVRCSFVEFDKPRRAVRTWNWVRRNGARGPSPFNGGSDVLEVDSVITVSLDEEKREGEGEGWTQITIKHQGLPREWAADMNTYWAYQLAIADHAAFGKPAS